MLFSKILSNIAIALLWMYISSNSTVFELEGFLYGLLFASSIKVFIFWLRRGGVPHPLNWTWVKLLRLIGIFLYQLIINLLYGVKIFCYTLVAKKSNVTKEKSVVKINITPFPKEISIERIIFGVIVRMFLDVEFFKKNGNSYYFYFSIYANSDELNIILRNKLNKLRILLD